MKLPKIKIAWTESHKVPTDIEIRKIANGYILGNIYYATEEELFKSVCDWLKEPYAQVEIPAYKAKKN